MKKWVVYLLGVLTGVVLTFLVIFLVGSSKTDKTAPAEAPVEEQVETNNNVTFFDEPGDVVNEKSYKVIQVVSNDAALVMAQTYGDLYTGTVYLVTNNEGKYYYDDQIIKPSQGKVFKQIGIYRYPTRNDIMKTVPIIMMMNK